MSTGARRPASDVGRLRDALQHALMLEHATIPAYLCALYSIEDGTNVEAAEIIRSVVMEEMLHMVLVANVLNAVGGEPSVDHAGFVPRYPTQLPYSDGRLVVGLRRFSPEAVETFLAIERPEPADARPLVEGYDTIGQLYAGIELELRDLGPARLHRAARPADRAGALLLRRRRAIRSSSGTSTAPWQALEIIVDQGEGLDHTIHEAPHRVGAPRRARPLLPVPADRRRLPLPRQRRRQRAADRAAGCAVDWDAVLPMRDQPAVADLPSGQRGTRCSARRSTGRTASCCAACTGRSTVEPDELIAAVPMMYQLRYQAVALMRIPCGSDGRTAGPSFEWTPPAAR